MYWRSAWERQPFDDVSSGEDTQWLKKLGSKVLGVGSLHETLVSIPAIDITRGGLFGGPADTVRRTIPGPAEFHQGAKCDPRMIASIHGSNSSGYQPEKDHASSKRVPEFDSYCERIMRL